jgi:glycosyltransferase involved in cell wall biosynthesis
MIKKHIPHSIKQWLWFVFKSPPRHYLGYHTIWVDIRAWFFNLFKEETQNPISLCIGIKNRSHNLLTHLLPSLNECKNKELIELSIVDCGSTDIENLEAEIKKQWQGQLIYTCKEQAFARSKTFNQAAQQARHELLLICDADMSLPKDVLGKVNHHTGKHSAWFPHVWYTNEDGSGRYYTESTGMFASQKKLFLKAGGYDESITEWGKEDWLLFFEFYKIGISCIRSNERDFIHHWHPSLKPKDFKPLF